MEVSIAYGGEGSERSNLNDRSGDKLQHVASVLDSVLPLLLGHNTRPKLSSLCVVILLPLVPVMDLADHNIVRDLIRCLGNVRPELLSETFGRILLVVSVICIHAHRAVEVQGRVELGQKRAVDRDLVQVDTNAMVLGIAVEEHAELQKWVG